MSNYSITRILPDQPDDCRDVLALCRVPIRGDISLAFERNPDYFAGAAVQNNLPEVYICRDQQTKKVCGVFGVGKRLVWRNGTTSMVRYFSDLRIAENVSGSRLFFEIGIFVRTQGFCADFPAQTIIFADNEPMLNLVKNSASRSARLGLPYYHAAGDYVTYLIPFGRQKRGRLEVRLATESDVSVMQAFHDKWAAQRPFYPVFDFSQLGQSPFYKDLLRSNFWLAFEKGQLVGMTAGWNQKAFKQTRIVGYARYLSYARPLLNWLSPVVGTIPLPPAGAVMPYINQTATLIAGDRPEILLDLTRAMLDFYTPKDGAYLLAGGFNSDPLLAAFAVFKQKKTIMGRFFWVSATVVLPEGYRNTKPYFDVARI